jgi:hypothetical protein
MLVKIFTGTLNAEAVELEDMINQWLGSLTEEKAEIVRMSTATYATGPEPYLVVTILYQSPLESNAAAAPKG